MTTRRIHNANFLVIECIVDILSDKEMYDYRKLNEIRNVIYNYGLLLKNITENK